LLLHFAAQYKILDIIIINVVVVVVESIYIAPL